MRDVLLAVALGGILIFSGCSGSPAAPTPIVKPVASSPDPLPAPVRTRAPLDPIAASEGRVFVFASTPLQSPQWYTQSSRYVLYHDGRFALQYPTGSYGGTYRETGSTIIFDWDGRSAAGPWLAGAELTDGRLEVRYNLIMHLTDFEDAEYVQPPSP